MRYAIALLLVGCSSAPAPVPSATAAPPVVLTPGQAAFESTCAVCHQASGSGVPGTFPPLAGSEWVRGKAEVPIAVVLRGLQGPLKVGGMSYAGSMPPQPLDDAQIAEILTYVRSSWGNDAGPVTAAEVSKVRARVGKGDPWSEEALKKAFR